MKEVYRVKTTPKADQDNQVVGERYRITILTDGLIRLEYNEAGVFEDRATQMVFHRDFPKVDYRVVRTQQGIQIHTSRIHLVYDEQAFSSTGLTIQVKGKLTAYHSLWRYGQEFDTLGGTARTLDQADGAIPLEHGVLSRNGFSVLDDSRSQIVLDNGWLEPRANGVADLYFFGYGHDYLGALKDFYRLCGATPMLPRYALGNWWSRYYRYTEESYLQLMEQFDRENIPFTVAVIDMDWHLVDIDPKYGSGWTGYTWNRELFPQPAGFLEKLHSRGMHTTLNVHPADGIRAHEEEYLPMAQAMGVDTQAEDPVLCDLADPVFIENYFTYIHHPREREGVDFWWIDWQQGNSCKVEGLDPLWILNHYHFLDNARDGKRPLTFSRYAGPGSHRYSVGFSGDTLMTWESLDFQPYFTATASNIGYSWWSHDIGGHMLGYKDDEMSARWVQLGVYSPVMRLHSSCSPFNGKEPWRYRADVAGVMGEMLRWRHKMVPYLYTMNHRNHQQGCPLVMPLYYLYPEAEEAYTHKNQYFFGSELMVVPITTPMIRGIRAARVTAWLPQGIWHDIHTGLVYDGNRTLQLYRGLDSIPVLARGGGILPLTEEISALEVGRNPNSLRIKVFVGGEGSFTLYEDDNTTQDYLEGKCCTTAMTYTEKEDCRFTIHPAQGCLDLIPQERSYTVELIGFVCTCQEVAVRVDGVVTACGVVCQEGTHTVTVHLPQLSTSSLVEIVVPTQDMDLSNRTLERCFDLLNRAEIPFSDKDRIYTLLQKEKRIPVLAAQMLAMEVERDLLGALMEILTANG